MGVMIEDNLSSGKHISNIFDDKYRMLQTMGMYFNYKDRATIKKIITLIRLKVEYAEVMCSLYTHT